MTLYQVVDEKNYPTKVYQQHEVAIRCIEVMAELFPEHRYHIEELVIDETTLPNSSS